MTYKKVKTLSEQVNYLEEDKNVSYNKLSKKDAEEILYTYSYINVITPFKHRFAEKDKKTGETIRNNGKHVYPRKVDFSEYFTVYQEERLAYPRIYKNLMRFETSFNSILAYEVEQYYKLDNEASINRFFDDLILNTDVYLKSHQKAEKSVSHMKDAIDRFPKALNECKSVFIFLDRLMLNDLITIFRCSPAVLRSKIFQSLLTREMTFGYKTLEGFDLFLTKYAQIRNYVCHFSSLEVLVNYKDFKNKTLRHKSQRDAYKKAIIKLSE